MKHKSIRYLLRHLDEQTAVRLGERHPALTDADNERLLRRIEQNLAAAETLPPPALEIEQKPCRFENLRGMAAAAACFLVCGGTVAGLFWLQDHQPPLQEPEATVSVEQDTGCTDLSPVQASLTDRTCYSLGEPCPADHLCASGSLRFTAERAEFAGNGQFGVTLTIESEQATAWDGGNTFLLDNLLLETETGLLSPCGTDRVTTDNGQAFAVTLRDGQSVTLTLYYDTAGKFPTVLHTGADVSAPCIRFHEGGSSCNTDTILQP